MAASRDILSPIESAPVRFFGYAPGTPADNMAIDRALLYGARFPAIRLYSWSPPGVSLGWFQRRVDVTRFENAGYQVVRRVTGGGAVVHHHELTYAIVLPLSHPSIASASVIETYHAIHAPIREALLGLGIDATDRGGGVGPRRAAEPDLCFERSSPFDVIVRGRKIAGSAQRRLPDRVLQHGSIILEPNPLQPGQPSLSEIAGRPVGILDLVPALEAAYARAFGPLVPAELTAVEKTLGSAGTSERSEDYLQSPSTASDRTRSEDARRSIERPG